MADGDNAVGFRVSVELVFACYGDPSESGSDRIDGGIAVYCAAKEAKAVLGKSSWTDRSGVETWQHGEGSWVAAIGRAVAACRIVGLQRRTDRSVRPTVGVEPMLSA
jgi:hypothetical protein